MFMIFCNERFKRINGVNMKYYKIPWNILFFKNINRIENKYVILKHSKKKIVK